MRAANAASTGIAIELGPNFPSQVQKTQTMNLIELTAVDTAIPANLPLEISIILTNPDISPQPEDNIWTFETFSTFSGTEERINCNLLVEGFKVFGEFSEGEITGTVLSPVAATIIGVRFMLKSQLTRSTSSQFKVWMPRTWRARPGDDGRSCADFSLSYNPNREGVTNAFVLPGGATFVDMPSGTVCIFGYDSDSDLNWVLLNIDSTGLLDDGLRYAFEFGAQNPQYNLPTADNMWRFETYQNNVILHLQRDIAGYELEQIQEVLVTPGDTTALAPMNRMAFQMMSNKYIQGGSKIRIIGPLGFRFNCAFFQTDSGLSSTTTCLPEIVNPHIVEFTIDSQDPKAPNTRFTIYVYVRNPEFTPQNNWWTFEIANFAEDIIDRRDFYQSFDITRRVAVDIHPFFPYIGQVNPLRITFAQSTIMNQADNGNELVVTAPTGYVFPQNCSNFEIRVSGDQAADSATQAFPPPGITCTGYGNASATIRLPDGVGLFIGNYTIQLDIENPAYAPNETDARWTFITRVRNPEIFSGQRIVDANTTIAGFSLYEMVPARSTETPGAAHPRSPMYGVTLVLFALALHLVGRGGDVP
jgi:hypothetical protein